MTKFTPGPWLAHEYYDGEVTVTDAAGFEHVSASSPTAILFHYAEKLDIPHWADSPEASREISEDEQRANAFLIAAAPELFAACELALKTIGLHEFPITGKRLHDALAKAKGPQ